MTTIPDLTHIPPEDSEDRKLWEKVLKQGFVDKNQRQSNFLSDRVDVSLKHYTVDEAARMIDSLPPAEKDFVSGLRRNSLFSLPRPEAPKVVAPAQSSKKGPVGPGSKRG